MSFFAVTYMDYRHTLTTNIAKVESSNGVKFSAEELKDIEKEAPFTAYLEISIKIPQFKFLLVEEARASKLTTKS